MTRSAENHAPGAATEPSAGASGVAAARHDRQRGTRSPAAALTAALLTLVLAAAPVVGQYPSLEERAATVHDEALVWDGHNDLPWRIRAATDLDLGPMGLESRLEEGHTDLARLRESGIDAQFWSVYTPAEQAPEGTQLVLEQIDLVKRMCRRYSADLEMAYSADDVARIAASGRTACLLGAEGGHAIGNSLPVLRELYRSGVRYMTLTHFKTLPWADAAGDTVVHGGLTDFGREVVREMNRLGMLVDLSHVTADVMRDALEVSRAPVIFSHSSARALADHPRNVPDDVLRRLERNGGVVMVTFVSHYLTPEGARNDLACDELEKELEARGLPDDSVEARVDRCEEEHPVPPGTVETVADHIDHVVRVAGVEHVGVGSDWDGTSVLPEGLGDVSGLPNLTEELLRRGYSETEVEKIMGGNVLRVLRAAEETAHRLRGEAPALERLEHRGLWQAGETEDGG